MIHEAGGFSQQVCVSDIINNLIHYTVISQKSDQKNDPICEKSMIHKVKVQFVTLHLCWTDTNEVKPNTNSLK